MAVDYMSSSAYFSYFSGAVAFCFWLFYVQLRLFRKPPRAPYEKYPPAQKPAARIGEAGCSYSPLRAFIHPGRISHTRLFPKVHAFSYPYLMVTVPVRSFQSNWLLSVDSATNRWWKRGWLRVDAQDHLGRGDEKSLGQKLDLFLQSQGHEPSDYPIVCLVTSPRFLGYKFSPASFWYLYSADLELTAMIAEVNNTFDERRVYLLPAASPNKTISVDREKTPKFHHAWEKDFHVSPFSSRKGSYTLSADDLFRAEDSQGADAINVTATLISSKGRPKLVARLWSMSEPLDPAAVSVIRAFAFLISWSLVGWMTYPRIAYEAIMLAKRRKLHIWYRPEPRIGTISRRSTTAERYLGSVFRDYVQHITLSSPDAFHLFLSDPTSPDPNSITSLSTSTADQSSPTLKLSILTPKFYAFVMSRQSLHSLLSTALLDPAIENRTAHADDSTILINLLTYAATKSEQGQIRRDARSMFLRVLWATLMLVRGWLPFTGVVYPNPGLPAARGTDRVESVDIRSGDKSTTCFLDDFVREMGVLDQVRYVIACITATVREAVVSIVGGA